MTEKTQGMWFVYMLRCADNSLYTGITTDVQRRFGEHQSQGRLTARYLRGRGPLELALQFEAGSRSDALQLEYLIKQLSVAEKRRLVGGQLVPADIIKTPA
jgi:putative endonuclease